MATLYASLGSIYPAANQANFTRIDCSTSRVARQVTHDNDTNVAHVGDTRD